MIGPPHMVQNIQWMFVLYRPKRSVDIKVERKLHDMRILDRVPCAELAHSTDRSGNGDVDVRSTEQSVRHLLTLTLYHIVQQKKKPLDKESLPLQRLSFRIYTCWN